MMHKACSRSQSIYCFGFCISELASKFSQDLPFCFTCIDVPRVSGGSLLPEAALVKLRDLGTAEQNSAHGQSLQQEPGMWEVEIRGEAPQQGE